MFCLTIKCETVESGHTCRICIRKLCNLSQVIVARLLFVSISYHHGLCEMWKHPCTWAMSFLSSGERERESTNLSHLPVPHINETKIVYYKKEQIFDSQLCPALSDGGQDVEVEVDEDRFPVGTAGGLGCNCLINTLRQPLEVIVDDRMFREELEKKFEDGDQGIIPGDYLQLELPWADIIDLLW